MKFFVAAILIMFSLMMILNFLTERACKDLYGTQNIEYQKIITGGQPIYFPKCKSGYISYQDPRLNYTFKSNFDSTAAVQICQDNFYYRATATGTPIPSSCFSK